VLLRGTIDAGDYKQFIFPLLFYRRLCNVFDEETWTALAKSGGDTGSVQGDHLMRFNVVLANPPYPIRQWDRDAFASNPRGRNLYGTPPQGRVD
jgi:type I restriction-modification system DNA methylase subunit